MNVLVTSSRTPFALDLIRKLGESGHAVYAADTYDSAPGSHSRYLAGRFVTPPPDRETERYIDSVERIANEQAIDVIVPTFEEALFFATAHERLSQITDAPVGQVAIGAETLRLVPGARVEGIGSLSVKGRSETVEAFLLTELPEA